MRDAGRSRGRPPQTTERLPVHRFAIEREDESVRAGEGTPRGVARGIYDDWGSGTVRTLAFVLGGPSQCAADCGDLQLRCRSTVTSRLPILERRLEGDLAAVADALQAWVDWKRGNPAVALAVESLHRAGASPQADPGVFAPPAPDWGAEDRESKRQQALEAEREREAIKASLRAEMAGGAA